MGCLPPHDCPRAPAAYAEAGVTPGGCRWPGLASGRPRGTGDQLLPATRLERQLPGRQFSRSSSACRPALAPIAETIGRSRLIQPSVRPVVQASTEVVSHLLLSAGQGRRVFMRRWGHVPWAKPCMHKLGWKLHARLLARPSNGLLQPLVSGRLLLGRDRCVYLRRGDLEARPAPGPLQLGWEAFAWFKGDVGDGVARPALATEPRCDTRLVEPLNAGPQLFVDMHDFAVAG